MGFFIGIHSNRQKLLEAGILDILHECDKSTPAWFWLFESISELDGAAASGKLLRGVEDMRLLTSWMNKDDPQEDMNLITNTGTSSFLHMATTSLPFLCSCSELVSVNVPAFQQACLALYKVAFSIGYFQLS